MRYGTTFGICLCIMCVRFIVSGFRHALNLMMQHQGSNLAPARLPNAGKKSLGQAKLFPSLPCWQSHFKGPKFNISQLFPKTRPRRTLTGYPWNTRGSTHSDWPTCQAQRRPFWIQILSLFSVKRKGKYDSDCSESDSDVEWLTQLQEVLQLWTLSLPQSDFLV